MKFRTNDRRHALATRHFENLSQFAVGALLLASACAHAAAPTMTRRAEYLMGTTCEVTIEGSVTDTRAALDEVSRVESLLSTWRKDTPLARLNSAPDDETVRVDGELFDILQTTVDWAHRTDSAFNPLVGRLVQAWHLRSKVSAVDPIALRDAVDSALIHNVSFDAADHSIRKARRAEFEEGGFGKGYALDRAVATLRARGVEKGDINFGGQIFSFGGNWRAVIADPTDRTIPVIELSLPEGSISTSSGSEKSWELAGRTVSHILDPRTGEPLPPRGSVTVFNASGIAADILSTALYVMGPDNGLQWANSNGVAALYLIPGENGIAVLRSTAMEQLPLRRLTPNIFERN